MEEIKIQNNQPSRLPPNVKPVVDEYLQKLEGIFGTHLREVLLFGSYARGETREDSDVDIMVISDLPKEQVCWSSAYWKQAVESAADISQKHDFKVLLSPKVEDASFTTRWSPLLHNVQREGISLWKKT